MNAILITVLKTEFTSDQRATCFSSKLHEKPFEAYQSLIKATKYVLLVVLISCEENGGRNREGNLCVQIDCFFVLFL